MIFSEQCLGQAWYLDCEMQMFLIILLVIIPLWKWGRSPPYAGIIQAGTKNYKLYVYDHL